MVYIKNILKKKITHTHESRWALLVAQLEKNPPAMPETGVQVRKITWRRKWHPSLVLLAEKSHGQRSLVGYSL